MLYKIEIEAASNQSARKVTNAHSGDSQCSHQASPGPAWLDFDSNGLKVSKANAFIMHHQ
jgi:hypothetical protein